MKKLLSILGTIGLTATSTTSLISCEKPNNNIPCKKENHGNWKQQCSQEKPFNEVDNKHYYVVWRGDKNENWKIVKLKNDIDIYEPSKWKLDKSSNYYLGMGRNGIYIRNISGFIKSKTFNNGYSDTYFKVYRWYGTNEPNTPFISPKTGQITDWNLKQQVNINNNKDNKIKINVKNKDISENKVYQLEANYFSWLSITNELETNNIPSLIPAEIKLSDGEYGKYLTNLIISNDKIEEYLNYFSQWYKLLYSKSIWMRMTKNLVEDNIKITYDEKLFTLNQIEISGIWGYGNYDINIFTEKPNEKIIEGKDINLELIQNTTIGTKASWKDRNTYLQLIEEDTWYLWKNGVEDEKSYSNIAVVNFLKQSNSVIFSYPPTKEKININNLQLFNKNNEKLSLITLEI
ncbi:MAG: hypothetical protein SPLM_10590 [Spiroplasma phoeniceum]|uniref:lipoprotein n=1 Tax=Spiroplasma phoeniceum TaxID=47835 RepID=UPI003133F844